METFEIEIVTDSATATSIQDLSSKVNHVDPQLTTHKSSTWKDFLNPLKVFSSYSEGATDQPRDGEEDFSDLEMLQFLQTGKWGLDGQRVVLLIAKHLPLEVVSPDRLYRYVIAKLEPIADESFVVVYMHTESSYWLNSPVLLWLWRTYNKFPSSFRTNMQKLFVVHPDFQLHASMWLMCRWMSDNLWSKVQFCLRLEFLWDDFDKNYLPIPASVMEHDEELEESPLMDYGIITNKEWSPPGGPDLSRYQ